MKQHSVSFLELVSKAKEQIQETDVQTVKNRQDAADDFHLIDVREDREWQRGHCAKAVHIGKGVIECYIEKAFPDLATPLVLYCGGGYRSALACLALQQMGYTNVSSMDGGFSAWQQHGYPVEHSTDDV